jgi:hypothetical protein
MHGRKCRVEKIRGIVDENPGKEAVRTKLLRTLLRFGWIVLLAAAAGILSGSDLNWPEYYW